MMRGCFTDAAWQPTSSGVTSISSWQSLHLHDFSVISVMNSSPTHCKVVDRVTSRQLMSPPCRQQRWFWSGSSALLLIWSTNSCVRFFSSCCWLGKFWIHLLMAASLASSKAAFFLCNLDCQALIPSSWCRSLPKKGTLASFSSVNLCLLPLPPLGMGPSWLGLGGRTLGGGDGKVDGKFGKVSIVICSSSSSEFDTDIWHIKPTFQTLLLRI